MKTELNAVTRLLTVILIVIGQELYCQSSFIFRYSTSQDEVPCDAVETSDGGLIISSSVGTFSPRYYNTLLIKLNASGDSVKTFQIDKTPNACYIGDLVRGTDGNYFGIGTQVLPDETKLWLIKVNDNLEILVDTTYSIDMLSIVYFFGFTDHDDNLIIYGCSGIDYFLNHIFIYRLTQGGDSLSYKYYPDSGNEYVFSMIEKYDSSGYFMAISGNYQVNTNGPGQLLTFDSNFNVTDIDSLPMNLQYYYNLKLINSHQIILTGKQSFPFASPRTDKLAIHKIDTSLFFSGSYFLGPWDTISYPGYLHNLDFIDTNNIYFGGTCNQALFDFSTNKSYFLLGNFDSELNLQWQKYIGGDMYYTLWSIRVTSDGGCLLIGCTYDYLTQDLERDILIIKVDSNGIVTTTDNNNKIRLHDVIVYPNPGTDYFVVKSGPQVSGAGFIMWDVNGNIILKTNLTEEKNKVDTHSWLPGGYFWLVSDKNKIIESGKWIKQ